MNVLSDWDTLQDPNASGMKSECELMKETQLMEDNKLKPNDSPRESAAKATGTCDEEHGSIFINIFKSFLRNIGFS